MNAIENGFNARFWTGSEYRSKAYKGDTDDRANALAVVAGLAAPDKHAALRQVFAKHHNASPYMEKYVLEALFLMDAPEQAMDRMRERWKEQIESPITTLWEGWGIGSKGYGGGTYNHAWSGGALTVLSQYAAGVAPEAAGFTKFHVLPQLGARKSIQAVVATPMGSISVNEENQSRGFKLILTVPHGASGIVGIPKESGREIDRVEVNDQLVWERGERRLFNNECSFAGEDARYIRFKVTPGKWRFVAINK